MVECRYFRDFLNTGMPGYIIPNRQRMSRDIVPKLYKDVVDKIRIDLLKATEVCLTSDGWTSRAHNHYVAVTAHFIDIHSHILKSYVIGVEILTAFDSASHVRTIERILARYPGLRGNATILA